METPLISILVPIFNAQKTLRRSLDSLVNQSLDALEIICIDFGSTDNSLSIAQEYAKRDVRVAVLTQSNDGRVDTMNSGFKSATGKYIGIVNCGDYVDTNMFETLTRTAILNDAEVVLSNYYDYALAEDGEVVESLIDNLAGCIFYKTIKPNNNSQIFHLRPVISTGIYKKDLLEKNGIRFTSTLADSCEQVSFYFNAMLCANRVFFIPDAFLRNHANDFFWPDESLIRIRSIQHEFQEIWEFAKLDADRFEKAKFVIPSSQFDAYWLLLSKLTPAYQWLFFEELTTVFSSFKKQGYLDKENFDIDDWELLKSLLENPSRFFFKNFGPASPGKSLILNALEIDVLQTVAICKAFSKLIDDETEVFVVSHSSAEVVSILKKENAHKASSFYSDSLLFESRITLKPSHFTIRGEIVEILDAGTINPEERNEDLCETLENEKVSFDKATFVDSVGFVFKDMEEVSLQGGEQQRVSFCKNLPFNSADAENLNFYSVVDGVAEISQLVKNVTSNDASGLNGLKEIEPYEPIWNRVGML